MKIKIVISLAVLVLSNCCFAQSSTYYGVQVHFGQFFHVSGVDKAHMEIMLDSIKNAGIKMIRDECFWSEVEKTKGEFNFPQTGDDFIKAAAKRGIKILLILDYNNPLYAKDLHSSVSTEENRRGFTEYCRRVVGRYSPLGIKHYEIWNEPNATAFWGPKPSASEYVELIKMVYPAIKEVDPDVTVLGCSTNPAEGSPAPNIVWFDFIQQIVSSGGLNYMDGVSFHPYRIDKSPDNYLLNDIRTLQNLIGFNKSIWITEIGYPTSTVAPKVSIKDQAAFVSQMYLLGKTVDQVKLMSYYDFKNDGTDPANGEHNFGLMNYDLSPKPAFTAYKTLIKEVGDKPLVDKNISGGWHKLTFGNSKEKTYAIWRSSGSQEEVTETFGKSRLRVRNHLGAVSYIYNEGKAVSLTYNNEPKLITELNSLPKIKFLEFTSAKDTVSAGQSMNYNVIGYTENNEKIFIDGKSVKWTFPKSRGSVDKSGKLKAAKSGVGSLKASFGGKSITKKIVIK